MIRKLSMVALLTLAGWANTSSAALIGVCTYAVDPACSPDFAIGVESIVFDYFDNGTGTLTIDGTVGNASFADGQLQGVSGNTTISVYGAAPGIVAPNDIFSFTVTVNTSGDVLSSNMTMNGRVGFNPAAVSYNGTTLDGNLITGATIDQLGWISNKVDFTGTIDTSSLLYAAGFGDSVSGLLSITGFTTGSEVVWDADWAGTGTLDVVVPVPAAFWLFASGLTLLVSTARRRKSF